MNRYSVANPRFDWTPEVSRSTDALYAEATPLRIDFPNQVDLRAQLPPVYDQGSLGSGAAQAATALYAAAHPGVALSRLMTYYNARLLERTVTADRGVSLRAALQGLQRAGSCLEAHWPYVESKFAAMPSLAAYAQAKSLRSAAPLRLKVQQELITCLANGQPFGFGFRFYESFLSESVGRTGTVQLPQAGEKVVGSHCAVAVGYDLTTQRFSCRNSFGASWGSEGHFSLPLAYLAHPKLAGDFWTLPA